MNVVLTVILTIVSMQNLHIWAKSAEIMPKRSAPVRLPLETLKLAKTITPKPRSRLRTSHRKFLTTPMPKTTTTIGVVSTVTTLKVTKRYILLLYLYYSRKKRSHRKSCPTPSSCRCEQRSAPAWKRKKCSATN